MHKFRKLQVWQKAMVFVSSIYTMTKKYPRIEQFGLIDQIRRAAVSVPLNIAEGSGSGSDKEFNRFLHIAQRSLYEVITAIEIANQLNYGDRELNNTRIHQADELGAMLNGLMKSLKADS